MYIPKHFAETDLARITELVNTNGFATLITVNEGLPVANHLPLLLDNHASLKLSGHMAKANEQWQHFTGNTEVLAIFQGPHAYISPSSYKGHGVPTWNYAVVHMYGVATLVEDENRLQAIIETLTQKYEQLQTSPWSPDYPTRMLQAIVGFEIEVKRVEAKFKLSQNRSAHDRQSIIANFSASGNTSKVEMARIMQE